MSVYACMCVPARHSGVFVNGVCMCVLTGMAQQHLGDVCVPVKQGVVQRTHSFYLAVQLQARAVLQ